LRRTGPLALSVLLSILLAAAGASPRAGASPPDQDSPAAPGTFEIRAGPFTVRCPSDLRREAEQIARRAPEVAASVARRLGLGLPASGTIILLASDNPGEPFTGQARAMPAWAAGQTFPASSTIILRLDRIGTYGQREEGTVLAHELAHLIVGATLPGGGAEMPIWFREGVASAASGEGEFRDSWQMWISSLATVPHPYARLDAAFASSDARAEAYAGSLAAVRFLRSLYGQGVEGRILSGLRDGIGFPRAFALATGSSLPATEAAWRADLGRPRKWIMWIGSALTLWIGVTFLILIAYAVKRRRSRRILDAWEPEEAPGPRGLPPDPYGSGDIDDVDDGDDGETIH